MSKKVRQPEFTAEQRRRFIERYGETEFRSALQLMEKARIADAIIEMCDRIDAKHGKSNEETNDG